MDSVGVRFSGDLEGLDNSLNWLVLEALVLSLALFSDSDDVDIRELGLEAFNGLDLGDSAEDAEIVSELEGHGLLETSGLGVLKCSHQADTVLGNGGDRFFVSAFFGIHTSEADFFELNWNSGALEDILNELKRGIREKGRTLTEAINSGPTPSPGMRETVLTAADLVLAMLTKPRRSIF